MKDYSRNKSLMRITLALCFLAGALNIVLPTTFSQEQSPASTPRRKWDPVRIPASARFVGREACAECHRSKAASQQQTTMGLALEPVAAAKILTAHPRLTFRLGRYSYEIIRQGNQSFYTVSDGVNSLSAPVLYTFGQGKAGQTFVLQHENHYYESRLSFYNDIQGLDLTVGSPRAEPASLAAALGREMTQKDTLQCFSCHSTGAVLGTQLHLDKLTPGISCEICHGPGGDHVTAGRAGQPNRDKIFNPGKLTDDEISQEFCGACHRSVEDVLRLPELAGVNNVRFQPYRIFGSRCYSDDRRIGCTSCHNPHEPLRQEAAYYDAKCLACHQSPIGTTASAKKSPGKSAVRKCKTGTQNCASCHMPKYETPGAHFKFTNHRIRIVKPGEQYPR